MKLTIIAALCVASATALPFKIFEVKIVPSSVSKYFHLGHSAEETVVYPDERIVYPDDYEEFKRSGQFRSFKIVSLR